MMEFLSWLFGPRNDQAVESRLRFEWVSLPANDLALFYGFGLFCSLIGVWYLSRWEANQIGRPARILLFLFRSVLILFAFAALCEPVAYLSRTIKVPAHLLVLRDTSKSLDIRDSWFNNEQTMDTSRKLGVTDTGGLSSYTRGQLVDRVIERGLLENLTANQSRNVHLLPFSESLDVTNNRVMVESNVGTALNRNSTAIGTAIRDALKRYQGVAIAGILVISDGRSNLGETPVEAAQAASDQGVLIHALAVGTENGPHDVALTSVETNSTVFVDELNSVSAFVQSPGMQPVEATVFLERRRGSSDWDEVARESVRLLGNGVLQELKFAYSEKVPGPLDLRVRTETTEAELTRENNQQTIRVHVVPPKIRVLFVAGSTFPEVQFIRNSLMLDKTIELSTWNQSAEDGYEHPGDTPISSLPKSHDELEPFDCIILYDPDPNNWPAEFSKMLIRFVSNSGGGLVFVAGEMQTESCFASQASPGMEWLKLLPVVQDPGLFQSEVTPRLSTANAWKLTVTESGRDAHVLQFSTDPSANSEILMSLPGMYWHFPVTRAKASANVLARHGDPRMQNKFGPHVLLASHRVGPGKAYFVGFDSTYRWRFVNEQIFDGFWARMVEQAGRSKRLGGQYPFRLRTDKTVYAPGDSVHVIASFNAQDPEDRSDSIHVEVAGGNADPPTRLKISARDSTRENSATFVPPVPGSYFLRAWTGDELTDPPSKTFDVQFQVKHQNAEFEHPVLDRQQLEKITSITGGRVFDLSESEQISDAFPTRSVERSSEIRHELWNTPIVVAMFVILLTTEWIVRKRFQLA